MSAGDARRVCLARTRTKGWRDLYMVVYFSYSTSSIAMLKLSVVALLVSVASAVRIETPVRKPFVTKLRTDCQPSLVQCQPAAVTFGDGQAPYYIAVLPAGQVSAEPVCCSCRLAYGSRSVETIRSPRVVAHDLGCRPRSRSKHVGPLSTAILS